MLRERGRDSGEGKASAGGRAGARTSLAPARALALARPSRRDDANLMLLSGILMTIAFIVTALTLAQVSSLERQAAAETPDTLATEWRFLHDRIPDNLNVSIASDTNNDTFANVTFPAISETFRSVEAAKGYDITMRLAGSNVPTHPSELDLVHSDGKYYGNSTDGRIQYDGIPYDGKDDGLLWQGPCPDGTIPGCVVGVLVYVHLSDGLSTLEETILVPTNHG